MEPSDVLRLADTYPAVDVSDGDAVIADGDTDAALFVLVSGTLAIATGGREIARITEPGSVVGEIGLLLGTPASADVIAVGDAVLRRIDDAAPLFSDHPDFARYLAVVLATRLRQVTTFLGDIERQFADRRDSLGLVPQVLTKLLGGGVAEVDHGSDREPDSPY